MRQYKAVILLDCLSILTSISGSHRIKYQVPFDTIIIANILEYVKKSRFLTGIICLGVCIQKAPDFINCGAAILLKMGSHDVGCAANRFLCLHWRLLHFGTSHLTASVLILFWYCMAEPPPAVGRSSDMSAGPKILLRTKGAAVLRPGCFVWNRGLRFVVSHLLLSYCRSV